MIDRLEILEPEQYNWAKDFIDGYFEIIKYLYQSDNIPSNSYIDILLLISDAFEYLKEPIWEEIGYSLCKKIKEELEVEGISPYKMGMFNSLGHQAFAVNLYSQNTGHLYKFSNSINEWYIKIAADRANTLMKNRPATYASHYDCIVGISGILYYLLDVVNIEKKIEPLIQMVNYLIYLTDMQAYKGYKIINFYIPKENLNTDLEKQLYPHGQINLGLSHGLMGPLLALSKAKYKGIEANGIDKAIESINKIYDQFIKFLEKRPIWPCYVAPMEYIKNLEPKYSSLLKIQRSSWCYGNISIARGFQMVYKYTNNKEQEIKYFNYLTEIIDTPIKNYNLNNPGICHGFASVIAIGAYAYEEKKTEKLRSPINKCVSEIQTLLRNENFITAADIIDNYFEKDISFLQGAGGLTASLLKTVLPEMQFGKIMMIK